MTQSFRRIKHFVPGPARPAIRRLLRWLTMPSLPYVQAMRLDGMDIQFLIADQAAAAWYADRRELTIEARFMRDRMARRGDVVLECGAHHGFYTILLAQWVTSEGKIVAIEASPKNAGILQTNVKLNSLQNVVVEANAVGAGNGRLLIADESDAFVISEGTNSTEVPVVPLDAYAHLKPTFLKIDVEGFEIEVLKGAKAILATRPKLAIEVHSHLIPRYGASADDIIELVGREGYDFWLQTGYDAPPEPYDGRSLAALNKISQLHLYALPKNID